MEAYNAEARAWADAQGFGNAYENGVETYGDAIDSIVNYLRSLAG